MDNVTLGSLVISRFVAIPVISFGEALAVNEGQRIIAHDHLKHRRVRLHTYHGVERKDCEYLVEQFADANGFKVRDIQCEWVCREYI